MQLKAIGDVNQLALGHHFGRHGRHGDGLVLPAEFCAPSHFVRDTHFLHNVPKSALEFGTRKRFGPEISFLSNF